MDPVYLPVGQTVAGGVVGSQSVVNGSELDAIHPPAQLDASVDGVSSTPFQPAHADHLPPSHPEPLSISQLVASPAPTPVVHSPSAVPVGASAGVEASAPERGHESMDTSDGPTSSSLAPPTQQPLQPSFSPSPVPQPPSVPAVTVAEESASVGASQLAPDQEALVASLQAPTQPFSSAQYDQSTTASLNEQAALPLAPASSASFPPPVQAERGLISPQPQSAYGHAPASSAAAPSANGFTQSEQTHSMPTPPPTVHEQDHQASSSFPSSSLSQDSASALPAQPEHAPAPVQQGEQQQQQVYAPAPAQQNGSPLPPPPADLPGSHPLAPPGAPFAAAFPTPAETQFDPVAPVPVPTAAAPYVPASTSGGLKREYSEGVDEQAAQQPALNGTAALYGFQTHEPVSKRAKVEGPPSAPLSVAQQKFFLQTVRTLKKMREAFAFSAPVDPIALGIPHYFQIITHPMDLTTLEYKLQASGPKPKGRADKGKYTNKDEVVLDFDRVWNNSVRFNGPDHLVSLAGLELEKVFDKNMRSCPKDEVFRPPPPPAAQQTYQGYPPNPYGQPQPPSNASNPPAPVRRASVSNGSAPAPRRNSEVDGRPKREIHPPVSKDLGWSEGGPAGGSTRRKSGNGQKRKAGGDEQMRYLKKELTDLVTKKQYYELAFPFMYPVDPIALNIPDYPKIVKRPMDLSTIRARIADGDYDDVHEVHSDIKLMFKNCYLFNPPGTPVSEAGKQLQNIWDEKWRAMPVKEPTPVPESESEEEPIDSDEETFSMVRQQMLALSQKLEEMQNKKSGKKSKSASSSSTHKKTSSTHHPNGEPRPKGSNTHPKTAKVPKPVQPSNQAGPSSAYAPPPSHAASKPKKQSSHPPSGHHGGSGSSMGQKPKQKKPKKGPIDEDFNSDDERATSVTMAQKQELADKIQIADGDVLGQAITIIQESMPLGDSAEEIELDIESLPPATVLKLYNLVVRGPKKPRGSRKGGSGGNKGGTGGLNRKSMNEDEEAEKIRKLEEKLGSFDQAHQPQQHHHQHAQPAASGGGGGGAKSDSEGSESGSDSASDSE